MRGDSWLFVFGDIFEEEGDIWISGLDFFILQFVVESGGFGLVERGREGRGSHLEKSDGDCDSKGDDD